MAVTLCLAASLCVFRLRSRMRNSQGLVRAAWIFLTGLEAGVAIWAAQFIALVAFQPGMASGYNAFDTLISLFVAVIGACAAFAISWTGRDRLRILTGAVVLTMVIGVVQFAELRAYKVEAQTHWEPWIVWCAMVSGAVISQVALAAAGRARTFVRQTLGAGLMTLAIFAVHFITLSAMSLTPDPSVHLDADLINTPAMLLVVIMLSILIVIGGMGAAYIDDAQAAAMVMRLRRLADAAREGIVVVQRGRIIDANAAFAALVQVSAQDLIGRALLDDLLRLEPPQPDDLSSGRRDGWLYPDDPAAAPIPVEVHLSGENEVRFSPGNTILTLRDLRQQREHESRIRYLAEHDTLTGLPNRRALTGRLGETLERAKRTGEAFAVISLNMNRFKSINDLHGQAVGDALLVEIGRRLTTCLTPPSFTARMGGDEFIVVLFADAENAVSEVADWVQNVMVWLKEPFQHQGLSIEPDASMGVCVYPFNGQDAETLLGNADTALNRAKGAGSNTFCFFAEEMDHEVRERRNLARDLRNAVTQGELLVFYQPQARASDGVICGFEALVRWRHPEHGMIAPGVFIPIAEEQGLIIELGEWVLRKACAEAARWPRDVTVAVNLSPLQLSQKTLADTVRQILFDTGLPPARLELEVTESALFQDYQGALDTLRQLKAMGLKVAMDDFGTGFSSLSTLQSFPFDKIKIDKSFVEGVGALERSTVIVRAVLGIGRGLAIPVVAEGVETEAQLAFLRAESCDVIQGYLLGKPAPIAAHMHLFDAPFEAGDRTAASAVA